MKTHSAKLVGLTLLLAVVGACSGSGVSTTARTDGADGVTGASADGGTSSPSDDGADDGGSGGVDDSADTGGNDSMDGGDDMADSAADTQGGGDVDLVGTWLSEGADIAPILVELTGAQRIDAVFAADSFTVVTLDADGQEVEQTGVYSATASGFGEIFDIILEQSTPTPITVEGIYEIDDTVSPAVMRYEVVQTMPSVGAVPPTAEGGFGSTSYADDLTQVFIRQ